MRLKPKAKKATTATAKRESKAILAQRELADRLGQCAEDDLLTHLKQFTEWTFGEGDIYNWIAALNRFDDFLSKLPEHYEPQTALDLPILKSSFPRETILQILRVTCLILENCFNRYLYGSAEHLGDLLRIDDVEIVLAALTLLSILVKKTRSRVTTRIHGDPILNAQLFYLTKGWGGKQDGLGLLYCVQDRDVSSKLAVGTTLQFEFFIDPNESKKAVEQTLPAAAAASKEEDAMEVESVVTKVEDSTTTTPSSASSGEASVGEKAKQAGHRSIQFPAFHLFTESNIDILTQLVNKYSIPRKYHFPLLMRIRLARAFPDVHARRDLVRVNLLAFTVLAQAHMDLGTLSSFFLYEPEFITELMELVKSDRHTPQDFRILALDALSALTTDRSRLPKVISATGSSQHHGELPSMVRKAVATLTGSVEHPIFTLPFIDSLFSFLAALMATPDGIAALNTAGIISSLLPLLRYRNVEHASVLMQCLSILEYYVAGSNSAAAVSLFRDLGGLDLLIERFNAEVDSAKKTKEQEATATAIMAIEADVSETTDKSKGKEKADTESTAAAFDEGNEDVEPQLAHHQRTLVKAILRILLPFIQGGGRRNIGRLTGVIEGPFPRSLCYVLENYHFFGERIFSLSVSIMSGLINNDPTRFGALAEAGLPRAFLTFVTQGIEPSASVICALPSAISALCLNPSGMATVVEANIIGALFSIFTTPKYQKVLKGGDTASRLGASVDELLRHHPSLRPLGIRAMIHALRRVCKMSGLALPDEEEPAEVKEDDDSDEDDIKAEPNTEPDASSQMAVDQPEASAAAATGSADAAQQPVDTAQPVEAAASSSSGVDSMELAAESSSSGVPAAIVKEGEEAAVELVERKVPPFVEPEIESKVDASLLSEYIGNLGRFLEVIFANNEHGRNFIDAHGMDLLFKLQTLPELPASFPSSSSAQSLALALRSLAAHHMPTLSRGVLDNMIAQFDLLDQLQPTWRDGSSFVNSEDNTRLVGVLASIDCLSSFFALLREPSSMLRQSANSGLGEWITDAGNRVSSSLGHLQRCILWDIAREAYIERKKAAAEPAAVPEAVPSQSDTTSTPPEAQAVAAPGETAAIATTAGEPSASTEPTAEDKSMEKKKETKQLLIHLVSSIHSVSQGLAKALGARQRNRDEKVVHTLAQTLVRTLQDHLTWTPKAYADDDAVEAAVKCAYLTSVVGELRSFLFNERYNGTHTLLLHQFNYVDGVSTFLKTFNWVVDRYVRLRERELEQQQQQQKLAADTDSAKDKGKEKLDVAPASASTPGADVTLGSIINGVLNELDGGVSADKVAERDADMEMAESALLTFGTVLRYLVCGPMVAMSPITANMMTQTLPGQQGPFDPHIFLGAIQSRVLLAVLPIWNHPLFAHFPQRFITSLVHANRYIVEGEAAAAAAAAAANSKQRLPPKPKKQFEPDPGVVTQLMEMGFSQRRAEEALRHIGANNVELAMDWIFTNPEPEPTPEPAVMPPAPAAADAAATTAAPVVGFPEGLSEGMSEDEELAAALAMSLGQSVEAISAAASPAAAVPAIATPPVVKEEPKPPAPPVEEPKKDEPVDYSKQYEILRKGMLERCVRLLTEVDNLTATVVDVLSSICKKPDDKSSSSSSSSASGDKQPDERAHVVEVLADQIKLAAEQPQEKGLYRLTHALTLLINENLSMRRLVAQHDDLVSVFLDLLERASTDPEISDMTSPTTPGWLATVLLTLDALCQLPSMIPSGFDVATPGAKGGDELMSSASSSDDMDTKDEPPQSSSPAAGATGQTGEAAVPPVEVPYLIPLPQRRRLLDVCVRLMKLTLHPDAMQALLQLESHLTRTFELAQQFLQQGGLSALLRLPPPSSFHGQVGLITTVLRHLVEDPTLLQHAMEAEIKSTITKLMGRSGALVKPKNFLATVAPLVCRDPVVFLRASSNVCRLRDPKPTVNPSRVVLCLAPNASTPGGKSKKEKGEGLMGSSSSTSAAASTLAGGLKSSAKSKRTTPSTTVQVITELTNSLLTLSRIKKAVDLRPKTMTTEGDASAPTAQGEPAESSMDTSTATEGDQQHGLLDMATKPTLSSGEILQILTDFITTYPPCGSVLLRQQLRKTSGSGKKGKGKEKKDAAKQQRQQLSETNNIISYILSELLPYSEEDAASAATTSDQRQKQNAAAANMLTALAQKPEGRRRVIDEITQAMKKVIAERDHYANYPEVIQALVDFLFLLLTTSASRGHSSGFLGEVARLMLDVDTIKTLTDALHSADLNHPNAPQLVNSILRPLEILTRLTAVMSAKTPSATTSDGKPSTEGAADSAPQASSTEPALSGSLSAVSDSNAAEQPQTGTAPPEGVDEPQSVNVSADLQGLLREDVAQDHDMRMEMENEYGQAEAEPIGYENEEDEHQDEEHPEANLTEATGDNPEPGSAINNITLNFINDVMQQARAIYMANNAGRDGGEDDLSESSSGSEDDESSESDSSDLSDEEEGGRAEPEPVLHHVHPEEDESESEEGEEDDEVEEAEEEEEEEEDEAGEGAYSYEDEGLEDQQDWGSHGDFDFSIQIGGQPSTANSHRPWSLNVDDLLMTGTPHRDLPRAAPQPPNPFLAEATEATHPLLAASNQGGQRGGLAPIVADPLGLETSLYHMPPSLRGNPIPEDEVRRLFGRIRAQRSRPGEGPGGGGGDGGQRTTPGMVEYAVSIEPLFVDVIRKITLAELKEKEDTEREQAKHEGATDAEGAAKSAEEGVNLTEAAEVTPVVASGDLPTTTPAEPTPVEASTPEDSAQNVSVPTTEPAATTPAPESSEGAVVTETVQESALPEPLVTPSEVAPPAAETATTAPPTESDAAAAATTTTSQALPVQESSTETGASSSVAQPPQPSGEAVPALPTPPPPTSVEEELGIDPAFLAALPEDLRAEILAEQLHARRMAAASRPPQPAPPATTAAAAAVATPAATTPAAEPTAAAPDSSSATPAPAPTAATPAASTAAPAVSTTSISPDFIAALPPEIQAEVLQQEQARAAAAAAAADITRAQAMTTADFFATLSPDLREEILMTQDEASLPPELAAEASALRERAMRQYQRYSARRFPSMGDPQRIRVPPPPVAEPGLDLGLVGRRGLTSTAAVSGKAEPLELEGRPIIEPSELIHLVRLLYLAKPLTKGLLHRLFLNLSTHKESRMQLLHIMLTVLDAFNPSSSASSSPSSAFACPTRRFASFAEALEALPAVTPSSTFSPLEDPCHPLLSGGTMNIYAHSGQHPPSLVARRVLEILCHLLKHNARIAQFVLGVNLDDTTTTISESGTVVTLSDVVSSPSSSSSSTSTSTTPTKSCPLARLMDLLGVDQFRNSGAQLEQLLQLLVLSVQPLSKLKSREERRRREREEREARERAEQERREREIREARERAEHEAAEQAVLEAELAAATAASAALATAETAGAAEPAAAETAATASGATAPAETAATTPVEPAVAPTAMDVDASAAPVVSPAETTPAPVPEAAAVAPETPAAAPMEVESATAPATTLTTETQTDGQQRKEEEEKKEKEEAEAKEREKTAEEVCPQLPVEDLRNLVSVLTLENCSESTYKNATHVLQQLSANALNREVLIKELINAAHGLAEVVVRGLDGLCEELASSFHPTLILSMASSTAELNLLRIIKTVMALPSAGAGDSGLMDTHVENFVDALRLEPLWDALERCLDIITESMERDAKAKALAKAGDAKGKARLYDSSPLPTDDASPLSSSTDGAGGATPGAGGAGGSKSPAANLLLPIIEVFFVVNAKDPGPLKRSASIIDFGQGAQALPRSSSRADLRPSASRENLLSITRSGSLYNLAGGASTTATTDEATRFALFAERHRGLLNDLVRQNPALLHGTFKVLLRYPRVLDFDNKRAWFRHQLHKLKDTRGYYGGVRLRVNRAKVFEDSYRIMSGRSPEELRGRMTVQFQGEEGIDAGGLTREWYDILAKEVFNADYALFINTAQDNSTFQPNRFSYYNPNHLDYFKFVGRVIGKAILDGYFLPCHFTRSFYKHILGITVQPSDMEAIDPEYYKNLRWILDNDPTPLDLTFSTEVDEFGSMRVVDLKEDGKNIPVTNENKHEYVQLVTEMRMTTSIKSQIDAFLGGFHDLIPKDLISVFNEMELELLISGLPEIDLDDLRANTLYTGYTETSPLIQWFWKAVNSFGQEERAKLLQFVTGTSRVPLDGFKSLRGISGPQKFQIHKSYRKDQLPAAHTCFNQLDLPEYDSYERLRESLMYAVRETEGFGFG